MEAFLQNQIPLIEWIQRLRAPELDRFFIFLNFFDTPFFYLLLIPILWMGCRWKWGARIAYLSIINALVNEAVKMWISWPRPFEMDPKLGLIIVHGHGFPSGAAQLSLFFCCLLIYYKKKSWVHWTVGINYVLWISFSRLYLGVHFPIDIFGGWVIGFLLFLAFVLTEKRLENFLHKQPLWISFAVSLLPPLLIWEFYPHFKELVACAYLGLGCGLVLTAHFKMFLKDCKRFWKKLWRIFIIIFVGVDIALLASQITYLWVAALLVGLWFSFGVNFFFATTKKDSNKEVMTKIKKLRVKKA
jgi:membrane-associated phospholipid phosphatase